MWNAVVLLSFAAASPGDRPVPAAMPTPMAATASAQAQQIDISPKTAQHGEFKRMTLAPIGIERVINDPDHGERQALERRRLGPDGEYRVILGLPKLLKPLEQIYDDTTALGSSLRVMESYGSPYPVGFQRVYEAPDNSGQFVRGNGALYATYPYGTYKKVEKETGVKAQTAPGSTFHIGMPLAWRAQPPARPTPPYGSSARLDTRIDTLLDDRLTARVDTREYLLQDTQQEELPSAPAATPMPSIRDSVESHIADEDVRLPRITRDEAYRRAFFRSLRG